MFIKDGFITVWVSHFKTYLSTSPKVRKSINHSLLFLFCLAHKTVPIMYLENKFNFLKTFVCKIYIASYIFFKVSVFSLSVNRTWENKGSVADS